MEKKKTGVTGDKEVGGDARPIQDRGGLPEIDQVVSKAGSGSYMVVTRNLGPVVDGWRRGFHSGSGREDSRRALSTDL